MKLFATVCAILFFSYASAQTAPIASDVYSWNNSAMYDSHTKIFEGSGAILSFHSIAGVSLKKGQPYYSNPDSPREKFFVIKNGPILVKMKDSSAVLNRGSVVVVLPGTAAWFTAQNDSAEMYRMEYVSSAPPDMNRGHTSGGSFWVDWNKIAFKPHDRGGVRQFFDRKTVMLNRFDIHVTTMNPGLKSHEPHTHKNEEIILMLQGNAEMQIGTEKRKANSGDVVFLGSNVLHNLTNIGTVPAVYYAIQWN
jgi:(S)-ureidoglycine aminohydrolase